jgi:hypothetical protein
MLEGAEAFNNNSNNNANQSYLLGRLPSGNKMHRMFLHGGATSDLARNISNWNERNNGASLFNQKLFRIGMFPTSKT